ncbi:MAG: PTS sugar transporter subunit IIA [Solobacterium sp.]|jgi:PTS system mannose-specific IIA component/D-glucosaminate-specific PTS system IIA component|nr:PTS sugar transporter subunit IIA [Solobacterium sp.]
MNQIKIVAMSHGFFAKELIKSAEMIIGPMDDAEAYCLELGQDPFDFKEKIEKGLNDPKISYLVLTDLYGGTPCNMASSLLQNENIEVVAGLNLAMLIEVYSQRNNLDMLSLKTLALSTLRESGHDIRSELRDASI